MHSKADRLRAALLDLFRSTKKPVTAPRIRKKEKKSDYRNLHFKRGKVRDEKRRRETAVLVRRATVGSKRLQQMESL